MYFPGETILLEYPTKTGETFFGWTAEGIGSSIYKNTLTIGNETTTVTANWLGDMFTYTLASTGDEGVKGTDYEILDDSSTCGGCWRIKFLNSGTFTPNSNMTVDTFLVGGGGGGQNNPWTLSIEGNTHTQGGGGGGYTTTTPDISLSGKLSYTVTVGNGGVIGSDGEETNIKLGETVLVKADGGQTGNDTNGGNGGSGGGAGGHARSSGIAGGSDGSTPANVNIWMVSYSGAGQGSTTREFELTSGTLYAGGGGGGCSGTWNSKGIWYTCGGGPGAGGDGGGGTYNVAGAKNTGGGGAGSTAWSSPVGATPGGSGIVVIRNARN